MGGSEKGRKTSHNYRSVKIIGNSEPEGNLKGKGIEKLVKKATSVR